VLGSKLQRPALKVGERIELLSNAGSTRQALSGAQGFLDIRLSDKNVRDFASSSITTTAPATGVLRREAAVSGGQYYLELSKAPEFAGANLLSVFLEPTKAGTAATDVETRLCLMAAVGAALQPIAGKPLPQGAGCARIRWLAARPQSGPGDLASAHFVLLPLHTHAAQSICPRATAQAAMIADYRTLECSKAPPPPYTGSLHLQSKYDQRDASKSTLRASPDADSERIAKQVKQFIGGLIHAGKRFQNAKKPQDANMALACQDQWLEHGPRPAHCSTPTPAVPAWPRAGAGGHGRRRSADPGRSRRQGATDARATALVRPAGRTGDPRVRPTAHGHRRVLQQPRLLGRLGAAAAGMLVGRDDFIRWADGNLRRGLAQAVPGADGSYAYLPLEARAKLAANYSQYALVPLVLLSESARSHGLAWSRADQQTLDQLASFAARSVLAPDTLPELKGQGQAGWRPTSSLG
jgi:poly(beta-D-mannuronate) lyase